VEPMKLGFAAINIIDAQVARLVEIKRKWDGLEYRAALIACARDNPKFFAARERLLSGRSQEELFRFEDGQLVAIDPPEAAAPRRCGPYEELFFGLVAERVDRTRVFPQEARALVARENPTVYRRFLAEVGSDAPPLLGLSAPMVHL